MKKKNQVKTTRKPKNTGTREWAGKNVNIAKGCEHNCHYCYAKSNVGRYKTGNPSEWERPVINTNVINRGVRRSKKTIMFPSSHDITPRTIDASMTYLRKSLKAGNRILIVSKPHYTCIKQICDEFSEYKEQILFRFTIGSADNETLKLWEPNAPLIEERLEALKYAFNNGYKTSISSEPMLDANIGAVIQLVREYVTDSVWLGIVKRLRGTLTLNKVKNVDVRKKAEELLQIQNKANITSLYQRYKDDPLIKWKDSIKGVVGIPLNVQAGMDI